MTAPLGILMLDTRFPRIVGDIGNPRSFSYPVLYGRLEGVGPQQAVREAAGNAALLDHLEAAAGRLVAAGAAGITTSCGFLAVLQPDLAARLPVPVATSSLLQVPMVQRLLPARRRVGILTAEAASLTTDHLRAVGVAADTPIEGMPPGGAFARCFLANAPELDAEAVQREVIAAGQALVQRVPDLGAIVIECTNLPPYAAGLQAAIGLPVYHVLHMLDWFQAGLRPGPGMQ